MHYPHTKTQTVLPSYTQALYCEISASCKYFNMFNRELSIKTSCVCNAESTLSSPTDFQNLYLFPSKICRPSHFRSKFDVSWTVCLNARLLSSTENQRGMNSKWTHSPLGPSSLLALHRFTKLSKSKGFINLNFYQSPSFPPCCSPLLSGDSPMHGAFS